MQTGFYRCSSAPLLLSPQKKKKQISSLIIRPCGRMQLLFSFVLFKFFACSLRADVPGREVKCSAVLRCSTTCCTSAGTVATTTAGLNWETTAGATTTFCRISSNRKITATLTWPNRPTTASVVISPFKSRRTRPRWPLLLSKAASN